MYILESFVVQTKNELDPLFFEFHEFVNDVGAESNLHVLVTDLIGGVLLVVKLAPPVVELSDTFVELGHSLAVQLVDALAQGLTEDSIQVVVLGMAEGRRNQLQLVDYEL